MSFRRISDARQALASHDRARAEQLIDRASGYRGSRAKGRIHDRTQLGSSDHTSALQTGERSLIASPLSIATCFSCLPDRGHGSLRGRKCPPQHLVRSTGAAMSTTGSHGRHAAQRPPSQSSCTLAPWATHPVEAGWILSGFLADSWLFGPAKGLARAPDTVQDHR